MKYIKTYETSFFTTEITTEIEYEIGDYIKIKDFNLKEWSRPRPKFPNGYNIFKFAQIIGDNSENDNFFNIEFEIIANNKYNKLYDNKNIIERKLTEKEIEEYKRKKILVKYNI